VKVRQLKYGNVKLYNLIFKRRLKNIMMKNRRGVSGIVTAVLLILVAIVAVALIAAFLVPFIKGTLDVSRECFDVLGSVEPVQSTRTCYDSTADSVTITVKRGFDSGSELQGIVFVAKAPGESKTFDSEDLGFILPSAGAEKTYTINDVGLGLAVSSLEVAPKLTDQTCDGVSIGIPAC